MEARNPPHNPLTGKRLSKTKLLYRQSPQSKQ
ncbi:MAG TPA: hypothetical protein ENK26_11740 [Gammaproteobacteria bacterium]|nr:hypothetical protein [Gammaproteobacteria bacterium]